MQIGMFDGNKEFINNKPIRLIELFGGIGCQAKALENLGIEFEHYRMCDFDKYAVQSYNAVHGTNFEPSDITKITAEDLGIVETDKYTYIMTYSFPCTDLSLAGKQEGMAKDSGTRSGLLWEVERLLKECKELPQILLMENVPQVHGKKNKESFIEWCAFLESKGYKNYWKDLNAKNYGIPQNRNRTFMVSLLGDYCYEFPEPIELKLRLKDMLESEVDEKYYLSEKALNGKINSNFGSNNINIRNENDIFSTLGTNCGSSTSAGGGVVLVYKNIKNCVRQNYERKKEEIVKSDKEIYQCACDSGWQDNKVGIKVSPTLRAGNNHTAVYNNYRIRKLTPLECWRLMGLRDTDFDKAKASGVSNSQLYKQAGNSIVVTVLMAIFGELLNIDWQPKVENLIETLKEAK